jgi:hypothetical protein
MVARLAELIAIAALISRITPFKGVQDLLQLPLSRPYFFNGRHGSSSPLLVTFPEGSAAVCDLRHSIPAQIEM